MTNLADLQIGVGVAGFSDLRSDFDRIPRLAEQAADEAENAFQGMDFDTGLGGGDPFGDLPAAADDTADDVVGIFQGLNVPIVGAVAAAGAAAGAALIGEFFDAMERDRMEDLLAGALALTPQQAEVYGALAGELYADAYGDSLGDVHTAVDAVVSTLGELPASEVEDLSEHALDLASVFGEDVVESVNTAGVLIRSGLAEDGGDAFDLLVTSMQNVPAAMRGELIPILEEYSQDFAAMGIDGPEAIALLVDAAGRGRFELDKTGDAIKELSIRSSDLSAESVAAYESMGMNAQEMARRFIAGGDDARGALDDIVEGLLAIEDPVDRSNTAIALFGTPLEDLSVTEIPQFLESLAGMETGFGDVGGAADLLGVTVNDNLATDWDRFTRTTSSIIEEWAQEHVIPDLEDIMAAFESDGLGGALDVVADKWEEAWPKINAWLDETVQPALVDFASSVGGEMASALWDAFLDGLVGLGDMFEDGIFDPDAGPRRPGVLSPAERLGIPEAEPPQTIDPSTLPPVPQPTLPAPGGPTARQRDQLEGNSLNVTINNHSTPMSAAEALAAARANQQAYV